VADQTAPAVAGRVLIADDDDASRQVTRLQIARLGYVVDEVTGGIDAVKAAETGAYQLILIDCQMPDMDGLTATAAIRRHEQPGRRAFIVALTADVSADQRERCRQAGMDDFLEKPLRLQTLADLLNRRVLRANEPSVPPAAPSTNDAVGTTLALLEADIGADLAHELVREYLAGTEQAIQRLARPDRIDTAGVRSTAHRLLGGARVLGLARFEEVWTALADGNSGAEPGRLPALLDELRAASAELTTWINLRQRKQHV
jgi:CheY-like chemotaxis protein